MSAIKHREYKSKCTVVQVGKKNRAASNRGENLGTTIAQILDDRSDPIPKMLGLSCVRVLNAPKQQENYDDQNDEP
jgi:hypothetical protein